MTPNHVENYDYLFHNSDLKYNIFMYVVGLYDLNEYNSYVSTCGNSCGRAYISNVVGVSPVINLKADVKFKGDGSRKTPYEIIVE